MQLALPRLTASRSIPGFKIVRLGLDMPDGDRIERRARIRSWMWGTPTPRDARAECMCDIDPPHDAPVETEAGCGFHAFDNRADALRGAHRLAFLARVEMSGRVIRHERGVRAERQRILDITGVPLCFHCRREVRILYHIQRAWKNLRHLVPMCQRCALGLVLEQSAGRARRIDIEWLQDQIGVPFLWAPPEDRDLIVPPWEPNSR